MTHGKFYTSSTPHVAVCFRCGVGSRFCQAKLSLPCERQRERGERKLTLFSSHLVLVAIRPLNDDRLTDRRRCRRPRKCSQRLRRTTRRSGWGGCHRGVNSAPRYRRCMISNSENRPGTRRWEDLSDSPDATHLPLRLPLASPSSPAAPYRHAAPTRPPTTGFETRRPSPSAVPA